MYKKFLAIDQYGQQLFCDHPRKEISEYVGNQHVNKMYIDTKDGPEHIGYVVGQHWFHVLRISPLSKK